jgi:hypothetical protein
VLARQPTANSGSQHGLSLDMRKKSTESKPKLVIPAVTDEDPMTSRRITKQPKKTNPVAKLARAVKKR